MDLIIKNFDKFNEETQQDIQDFIAGHTPEFILVETEEDRDPTYVDPKQKRLTEVINK